jgi:hypothetical protein
VVAEGDDTARLTEKQIYQTALSRRSELDEEELAA